jgi:Rieske Fe-S protein
MKASLSRRNFIKASINVLFSLSGLLGLGGLIRFFSYQPGSQAPVEFDLGDAANYPAGSHTIRQDIPAAIYNRGGEFMAYSLTCTHLGCTVEESDEGFVCPCHGSAYDKDGAPIKGPAQKRLQRLRVEILEDHTLRLYTDGGGK